MVYVSIERTRRTYGLLCQIKDVVLEGLGLFGSENLRVHGPARVCAILYGLVKVLRREIRVRACGCLVS